MLEEKSGRSRTRGEGRTYGEAAVAAIRYLRILKVARKFRHGEQRANRQLTVMTIVVACRRCPIRALRMPNPDQLAS